MIHIPIEQRYDKNRQMFHSGAFVAAGAIISVAAAGAGAAISYSGSQKAAASTARTSSEQIKSLQENQTRLQSALAGINTNIKIPDYSLLPTDVIYKTDKNGNVKINKKTGKPIIKEQAKRGAVPESIEAANLITKNTLAQVENLIRQNPADIYQKGLAIADQWQEKVGRAGEIVSQLAEGDLTERQRKQLAQVNAEMVGATYNPEAARRTAGFQIGQAQLLEATRQTSEERQRYGLAMIPQLSEASRGLQNTSATWMDLARSWAQPVTQVMALGLTGRAQDIEKKQFAIQTEMQKAAMVANTGMATAQGVAQARNDVTGANLATQMALAQGVQGVGSAAGSGLSSYGMATSAARGAGTIDYKGQDYGSVKGYGGQTYSPAVSQSGGLYYKAQPY
jgi:hypothetical protein